MKLFLIEENKFEVYISNRYLINYDLSVRHDLEKLLKNVFKKIEKINNGDIKGSYNIEIFTNKNCGCYLIISRKYLGFTPNDIDLKINILFDSDFYFITNNYETVKSAKDLYFYKNKLCINANNIDIIDKYVEFGEILPFIKINKELLVKIK